MNKLATLHLGSVFFLLGNLVACAPTHNSFDPVNNETGHSKLVRDTDTKKNVRAPYTIAGSKASFARLTKELGNHTDALLAQSVLDAEVQKQGDILNIRVRFQRVSLSIPSEITMRAQMKPSNGGLRATDVLQVNPSDTNFHGFVFCPQTDCKRVEIRLQKFTLSTLVKPATSSKNEIGILVSRATPIVQLMRRRVNTPYASGPLRALETALPASHAGTIRAEQKSVVVVEGPSVSKVWLAGAPAQQPKFYVLAELFDTSMVVSDIKLAQINGKNVGGRLVGNDPSLGDMLVEVVDGNETAMIQIEKDKTDIDPEDAVDGEDTAHSAGPTLEPGKAVFEGKSTDPKVRAATADLAEYGNHPETQRQVQWLIKNDPTGLRGFFTHAPNVSPVIAGVLEAVRVSPEFAYILPVESAYLKSGAFNATQVTLIRTNANNSAFGPWQIINRTAQEIKTKSGESFNYVPVNYMKWDPNDDRGYLVQATYMAGFYIGKLSDAFPQDHALALLAYHAGPGGAKNRVTDAQRKMQKALTSRLETISGVDITLAKVKKYGMGVSDESMDYAFRVLAWREIGQNPTKYGFGNIQPVRSEAFKSRLSRPNGPVPPSLRNIRLI